MPVAAYETVTSVDLQATESQCDLDETLLASVANTGSDNVQENPEECYQKTISSYKNKQEPYLSVNAIKKSEKLVHFYTGLENFTIFMAAFQSLGDNVSCLKYAYSESCTCLSPDNQFLVMLVKLK